MILIPEWRDCIEFYVKRIDQRPDLSPADHVVVILNADDENGRALTDLLMPEHDWSKQRTPGAIPYARGITLRMYLQRAFDGGARNPEATPWERLFSNVLAAQLRAIDDIAIVVMDFGTIAVFDTKMVLS